MRKQSQGEEVEPEEELETEPVEGEEDNEEGYKEKWLRTLADLENARKRYEKDSLNLSRYALTGFLEDLLPVVDNFYRALQHVPQDAQNSPWLQGVQYIQKNLLDTLEKYGVKEIESEAGGKFDPNIQEAIGMISSAEFAEGQIVEVKQKGYLLYERVLRPAQVIVSQGAEAAKPE